MSIKVVILFQMNTTQATVSSSPPVSDPGINYAARAHFGGWTESVIFQGNDVGSLLLALQGIPGLQPGLLPARAALLPAGAAIVGVRLYQGAAGKGQSLGLAYLGDQTLESDNPQQALLCKCGSTSGAVTRRFTLRNWPDAYIARGEATFFGTIRATIANYFQALSGFAFRAVDPASPKLPMFSIVPIAPVAPETTMRGQVTLVQATSPFTTGDQLNVTKAVDSSGDFVSGKFQVGAIGPNANQFALIGWGNTQTTKGVIGKKTYTEFPIAPGSCSVVRLVTRKVGRPSELYRGRRSRRRAVA